MQSNVVQYNRCTCRLLTLFALNYVLIIEVIVKGGNHHTKTFDQLLTDSALKHHRSAADNL